MFAIAVLMVGFTLLALCVAAGQYFGKPASKRRGALLFLPLWLLATGFNLWLGVSRGGTSGAEEAPMFALVFGIPAAIAGLVAWKSS